jgi:hypothetical protein
MGLDIGAGVADQNKPVPSEQGGCTLGGRGWSAGKPACHHPIILVTMRRLAPEGLRSAVEDVHALGKVKLQDTCLEKFTAAGPIVEQCELYVGVRKGADESQDAATSTHIDHSIPSFY